MENKNTKILQIKWKKTQSKEKWPVCTSKNQLEKSTFLALTNSKIIIFFKILKTDNDLIHLAKSVEKLLYKTTSQCIRKCKKPFFCCDVTKIENFDKKCLTL
jgi:hypothetical protein